MDKLGVIPSASATACGFHGKGDFGLRSRDFQIKDCLLRAIFKAEGDGQGQSQEEEEGWRWEGREQGEVKPWTQDNRLVPHRDLGESAVWPLELGPGPAPHCYLIIFCSRRSYNRGEGGG